MQKVTHEDSRWRWDAYGEFHVNLGPVVYFKTGEVIVSQPAPHIDERHSYVGGLRLATTSDSGSLWAPDGRELKKTWLDDNGMQYLLVDEHANKCVRLDGGPNRYRDRASDTIRSGWGESAKAAEYLPGVPERFQANAYAYIGGPGCHPIGNGKIAAWVPLRKALAPEQLEHVRMIEETCRTAMKLMDDPRRHNTVAASTMLTKGCPLNRVLAAQTWQDIPEGKLAELYHNGTQRMRWEFDWCYWTEPAHAINA